MRIGVLALQGDFAMHARALEKCGAEVVEIPVGVSVFRDELYPAPRSWAEQAYPRLIHFHEIDEGGHFAAWEQPRIFAEEMRTTFRSLR